MNKQQLASRIWESANKMRSKIEANEYKDYILGFIFYKFLSEKEVKWLKEKWKLDDDELTDVVEENEKFKNGTQSSIGYFISYENLFQTWLDKGSDFSVQDVRDALSAFSRLISPSHKKVFDGIFDTLQTGLSKLGDSSAAQSKAISDLIHLIKDIPMDDKQGYDVLGFIYEYLIGMFAANAGKKAGEFYTPHEVSVLKSEIVSYYLRGRSQIEIYDSCSGSGSLLINIGKSAAKYMDNKNGIKYYAQELKRNTYNLTRMNLIMRGILPDNICVRNGDTLEDDWPYFDEEDKTASYDPLYVDAVVSNPPYSQAWNPKDKENDPRYSGYGLAPKGKADYAFLLHDLYHLKPDGIMTIILPHGVLFRVGEEGAIRKNLIEKNNIEAIIGLPANIFFGTGIPTVIICLRQKRQDTDVLIIDASKGFEKSGKNNKLRASDIKRIVDAVINRASIDKFSRLVTRDEIRANDYNLNIPRYVDSSEEAETWDIYASMFGGIPDIELDKLQEYWEAFPGLREAICRKISAEYSEFITDNVADAVKQHDSVLSFKKAIAEALAGFDTYLYDELIGNMSSVNVQKTEQILSDNMFDRIAESKLIDRYEAYQIFDDEWNIISVDIETLQTEGRDAAKKVDPNYVIKKKDGKEQEVQAGWVGHVIPFELIQSTILAKETKVLKDKESRLAEITEEYHEIFVSLSDDEKLGEYVNEDSFVLKEVIRALKSDDIENETREKLEKVKKLDKEEKELKTAVKKEASELENKTKETIEGLSDEQVNDILKLKWISPLTEKLKSMPEKCVSELIAKLGTLSTKYDTTFQSIEDDIRDTEQSLSEMMKELCGNEYDMQGIAELMNLFGEE